MTEVVYKNGHGNCWDVFFFATLVEVVRRDQSMMGGQTMLKVDG